jgi:UDP-N-acetylmuramate dehydrogenase
MQILEHESLAAHTTLRLGGTARYFVSVTTLEELREALTFAKDHALALCVLGGGSNILFSDAGWDGLVMQIALTGTEYIEDSMGDARVTVAAGRMWDELVADTVSQGLWGMENLSGIPGTVGATPVQNVGAYGVEVADLVDWVEVIDVTTHALHVLSLSECMFGYRDSIFKHPAGKKYVVTRVAFRLSTHPSPRLGYRDLANYFNDRTNVSVQEVRDAVLTIRAAKFPDLRTVGTAGSFFKNPIITKAEHAQLVRTLGSIPQYPVDDERVKIPLAWLLEKFGWKGKRVGHVGCWDAQPLVVVHYGEGTATELILFADQVRRDIAERTHITIEPEVRIIG